MHAQVAGFLRTGRTEREVGADIADAILAAGHERVDFVIVASGPNGCQSASRAVGQDLAGRRHRGQWTSGHHARRLLQ